MSLFNILGLDLGKNMGFSIIHPDDKCHSGVYNMAGTWDGQLYTNFIDVLDELHLKAGPKAALVYEDAGFAQKSMRARAIYFGLLAHLQSFCEYRDLSLYSFTPGTIKKFVTGSGSASKDEVIAAVSAKYKLVRDHNEADAIALGFLLKSNLSDSED